MSTFLKARQQPQAVISGLQQQIDARFRDRIRQLQASARERSIASGRSVGWDELQGQIQQMLRQDGIALPDGYTVDSDGKVIYENKTPFLQQAAWAASPFAAGYGAQALAGMAGVGATGALPASHVPVAAGMTTPAALASPGVSASVYGAGAAGLLPSSAYPIAAGMTAPGVASQNASRGVTAGTDYFGNKLVNTARNAVGDGGLLEKAIAALANVPGLIMANRQNQPSKEELALTEQARKMAELQQQMAQQQFARTQYQNPLFQAVSNLAMNRLPTNVQRPFTESL